MTFRNLLLRAYPRPWRAEYGDELAGILAHRALTLAVAADVVWSGLKMRLRHDDPWKICGSGLFLWSCLGVALGGTQTWFGPPVVIALFTAALWTAVRRQRSLLAAGRASLGVAFLGTCPDMLAALLRGPVVTHAQNLVSYSWGMYVSGTLAVSRADYLSLVFTCLVMESLLLGLAGGLLGCFLAGLRDGLRENRR
jgi:hypothetical protein